MAEFKSYRSYWEFAISVRARHRYTRTGDQLAFLETVLSTSADKVEIVPPGSRLWRAQKGHDWQSLQIAPGVIEDMPCPYASGRMKPLPDRAPEGRANARGIPCLYVGTHDETAVAEVRPWVGAIVSLAQLRTTRELRLVNCTVDDQRNLIYFKEPSAPERELAVWRDIDRAFSRPVTIDDDTAHYAPTQVMAEAFREHEFDGIAYRSSLGPGHNIVLFDLDAAQVINCSIVEVETVQFTMSKLKETYFTEADTQ